LLDQVRPVEGETGDEYRDRKADASEEADADHVTPGNATR